MRVRWIPVLALVAAVVVGCGEAEPPGPAPGAGEAKANIVIVEDPPAEAAALPGCEGIQLPRDPEVVVALHNHDLAVVYDDREAVCAASVGTLYSIGLISDAEWTHLKPLFETTPDDSPVGSSDPIPAREMGGQVSSSDPIPAKPTDKMKGDGALAPRTR